jgi:hypothetical protein
LSRDVDYPRLMQERQPGFRSIFRADSIDERNTI